MALNPDQHGCTQLNIGGSELWKCLTCGAVVAEPFWHARFHGEDGVVQRCAECNGALWIVSAANDSVSAVRAAARQGRYLAERVTHARDVDLTERGHQAGCSRKEQ